MVDFLTKENYTIKDLVDIMKILRSDKGCPWDKEQNHQTIRKDFIEETYEVLEAIDLADDELLQEELGDVLLQVVFHSQIEQESGGFSFDDVCDGICKKLIVRHPHVFGEVSVKNTGEVLKNWDNIKQETKNQKSCTQTLESVPKILPSLMRSAKVIKRAKRLPAYSESFGDANSLFAEFDEKADEFKSAVSLKKDLPKKLGELLFSCVKISSLLDIDAEEALSKTCGNFIKDFAEKENKA